MRLRHVTRAELLQWIQVTTVRDAIVHPREHAELLAMVVGEILERSAGRIPSRRQGIEKILVSTVNIPQ